MNVRGEAYVSTVTVVSQSHTFKSFYSEERLRKMIMMEVITE